MFKKRRTTRTVVLILAATNYHSRWDAEKSRHLVGVDGEPLLVRTVRQLSEMGHDAIVVTDKPEIRMVIPNCFVPQNYKWIVSTMLSTRELWDDRTIVLSGDVVWDGYALGLILNFEHFPVFFGYGNEIFAITWLREHFEKVETALEKTEAFVRIHSGRGCYLNHFYAAFHGKNIERERKPKDRLIRLDWVTIPPDKSCVIDFDTKGRYEKWYLDHYGESRELKAREMNEFQE